MTRRIRRVVFAVEVLVIALCLAVLGGRYFLIGAVEDRKAEVSDAVSRMIPGTTATFGDMDIRLSTSGLVAVVDDISVQSPDGRPVLNVSALSFLLSPQDKKLETSVMADDLSQSGYLFVQGPKLETSVMADGLSAEIRRRKDGVWEVAGIALAGMMGDERDFSGLVRYFAEDASLSFTDDLGEFEPVSLSGIRIEGLYDGREHRVRLGSESGSWETIVVFEPDSGTGGAYLRSASPNRLLGFVSPDASIAGGHVEVWADIGDDEATIDARVSLSRLQVASPSVSLAADAFDLRSLHTVSLSQDAFSAEGEFSTSASNMSLSLPDLIAPHPELPVAELSGKYTLDSSLDWDVSSARLAFDSPVFGPVLFRGTSRGGGAVLEWFDVDGWMPSANAKDAHLTLPLTIEESAREWLRTAFAAGDLKDVVLRANGAPSDMFTPAEGWGFHVAAGFSGMHLDYQEDWPSLEGASGTLALRGIGIEVAVDDGTIAGLPASAEFAIPDLLTYDEILSIDASVQAPVLTLRAALPSFPPLAGLRPETLDQMNGLSGELGVNLDLEIPIRRAADSDVRGSVSFLGNDFRVDSSSFTDPVEFSDFSGSLAIDGASLSGALTSTVWGETATVSLALSGDSGDADTAVSALMPVDKLFDFAGLREGNVPESLAGSARFTVRLPPEGGMELSSDLVGVSSSLPGPLNKESAGLVPFSVALSDDGWGVSYGSLIRAAFSSNMPLSGEVVFGDVPPPTLSHESGIVLRGVATDFDIDRWLAFGGGESPAKVRDINLDLTDAVFLGGSHPALSISLSTVTEDIYAITMTSDSIRGTAQWDAPRDVLEATLSTLSVANVPDEESEEIIPVQPAYRLPEMKITIDDLDYRGRRFGALELEGVPDGDIWRLTKLQAERDASTLSVTGETAMAGDPFSRFEFSADLGDIGAFLDDMGHEDLMSGGNGDIEGFVAWDGTATDVRYESMDGSLSVQGLSVQYLPSDPGTAKLLGLLSPRTFLELGFVDAFEEGTPFDSVMGEFTIDSGVLSIDDSTFSGDILVDMSGSTDLSGETYDINGTIKPGKLTFQAVSTAQIVLAPVSFPVSAATFVFSELFDEEIAGIGAYDFTIKGTWDEPIYERVEIAPKDEGSDKGN